jgi:hypothetical protein
MATKRPRQAWHLSGTDFTQPRLYARQDWRFLLFFQFLRISPSYALALDCEREQELAERLGSAERARKVWRTRRDMGDVFTVLFKDWWQARGLSLFGIHTAKPRVVGIRRLRPNEDADERRKRVGAAYRRFVEGRYREQGNPDSVLISVPLGMKPALMVRQLKQLLAAVQAEHPPELPVAAYALEENKLREARLLACLRLIYKRSARPDEELWRAAARAKISETHVVDPLAKKKDAKSAEARRMLTIMASRLSRDALMIAENAAAGKFPSMEVVAHAQPFDFPTLGQRLKAMSAWEKKRKKELAQSAAPKVEAEH